MKKLTLIFLFSLLLFSNGRGGDTPFHVVTHEFYNFLGVDISFTPITYDMAGVWNSGESFFSRDLYLEVSNSSSKKSWSVNRLNLYTVKLPLLLCFELHPVGQLKGTQCHQSLCLIGDRLLKESTGKIKLFGKSKVEENSKSLIEVSCNG